MAIPINKISSIEDWIYQQLTLTALNKHPVAEGQQIKLSDIINKQVIKIH